MSQKSDKLAVNYEFGGPIGVFFAYFTGPILPLIMMISCDKTSCELHKFRLSDIAQSLSAYYDPTGGLVIVGFICFLAFVYALPLGTVVAGPDTPHGMKTKYRISAQYTLYISTIAYIGLVFFKYPVTSVIDRIVPIVAMLTVLSYVLTVVLYIKASNIKSSEVNPAANTGNILYDMYMGRELHPKLGEFFQLKLFIYRIGLTAWIFLDVMFVQKEFEIYGTVRSELILLCIVQIIYNLFGFYLDENVAIFCFDVKYEGVGFMALLGNFIVMPFVYSSNVLYLMKHPKFTLSLPMFVLSAIFTVGGLGLIIRSGTQKLEFRKNPLNPSVSGLKSIPPTIKGRERLLVSGYWGFVRHPNYLGEIILGIGYGLSCGFTDIFPWIYLFLVTIVLCHRALRDDYRCRVKHGQAWKEYCKEVKYRVVPFVF